MPTVLEVVEGPSAAELARQPAPFGPGVPSSTAGRVDRMVVLGTSFKDPEGDSTVFRLFSRGKLLAEIQRPGF